jgi:hypothetical protein
MLTLIDAVVGAVDIPTLKTRFGWDDALLNAPEWLFGPKTQDRDRRSPHAVPVL